MVSSNLDTPATDGPPQSFDRDESRKHFDGLDGLRGIAILLVFAHHFFHGASTTNAIANAFLNTCHAGWIGVDLFFVLSGFLITGILYDTKSDPNFFRNFYMRRFLRIFPLYYGVLFIAFVILPLLSLDLGADFAQVRGEQGWLWTYTVNLVMAYREQTDFGWFNHFWTLAIEEQFYLIWPLAVFFCSRRQLLVIAVAGAIFAAGLRLFLVLHEGHRITAFVFTFCRSDTLLLGGAIALLARSAKTWKRCLQLSAPVAVVCATVLIFIFFRQGGLKTLNPLVQTLGYSTLAILFCALVVAAVRVDHIRFLQARWLRFFGKYSYGLYVFHFLLMPFFYYIFPTQFFVDALGSLAAAYCVFAVFGTAVSVIVAWLSWHLYEKHFLRLKHRYDYRLLASEVS